MFDLLVVIMLVSLILLCLILTYRNEKTSNFRQELIDFIFHGESKIYYEVLVKEYNSISYKKILYTFWKPINIEFYKHTENLYSEFKNKK